MGSQLELRKEREAGIIQDLAVFQHRRAPGSWEFQVTHAGRRGVMLGQGRVNRAWSLLPGPWPFAFLFLSSPLPPHTDWSCSPGPSLLPLLSLAICSSLLWLLPNFRLTSDKKLGEVPLGGASSVPGLWLMALHAGDPYGLPWGCKTECRSVVLHAPRRSGQGLSGRGATTFFLAWE